MKNKKRKDEEYKRGGEFEGMCFEDDHRGVFPKSIECIGESKIELNRMDRLGLFRLKLLGDSISS
jgi:hypothetical protein